MSGQSVANQKTANITAFVNKKQHTDSFLDASVSIIALTAVNTTTNDGGQRRLQLPLPWKRVTQSAFLKATKWLNVD